ncbi:MAG TPA: hypothetical protein VGV16_02980 [Gammaproteobacteria bacterium]|nr:hypothetical protein [Gammaproteobacteria bacterium]
MQQEDYRNIPTDYVLKQALAWFLVFIGCVGVIFGVCIHFLGIEKGLFWGAGGLQIVSGGGMAGIYPIEKPSRRRAVVTFCLAVAALSTVGALWLHQYYLLFGACFLVGLTILFVVKRKRVPNIRRDK